jgi:dolichol-phosphate mannosyltransferase
MRNKLIIIPTYNEGKNAPTLIERIFKHIPDVSILIVDDGSPDGTAEICKTLISKFPKLHVEERSEKLGLGSAYRFGFDWGLSRGFDDLIEMDADMSHRVRDLAAMISAKESQPEVGLVIGSRWIKGGSTINWPKSRELLSRSANFYVRIMLGMGVSDATAGFRIYSADLLRTIPLKEIRSEGYSFQIEMTRAAKKAGARILEVPITFRERESGVSKMSSDIVREAMMLVTLWGFSQFFTKISNMKLYIYAYIRTSILWAPIALFGEIRAIKNWRKSPDQSQFGEYSFIEDFFGTRVGVYVDVGAGRPIRGSNTYALYKKGWRGATVDPIRINTFLSKLLRPDDIVIRGLIGEGNKTTFYQFFPYEYSTVSKERANSISSNSLIKAVQVKKQIMNVLSLNEVFEKLSFKKSKPIFLCIDAEGYDFEVLKSLDFRKYQPDLILIEDEVDGARAKVIRSFLSKNGYTYLESRGPSSFYSRLN